MNDIESIRKLLGGGSKIVLVTHPRPDGDAMGASLAMHNYFLKRGNASSVILPTEFPDYFKWMRYSHDALIFPFHRDQCAQALNEAGLIFCLDFNSLPRIAPVDKLFEGVTAPKVLIDHHLEPDLFDYMFHDVTASSTCELVYDFFEKLDGEELDIDRNVAQCLYTGLVTDTGNFQNNNTTVRSFELAAKLLRAGVDVDYIREKVFSNFKEKRIRFIGNALLHRMVVVKDLRMAYITVTKEDVRKYDLDAGDTEGLVNYPLTIRGVDAAVLVKEHGEMIKLSFRSKGDISVNEFARKYFSGGGHKNASGGKSDKSLPAALIDLVNNWKKEYSR